MSKVGYLTLISAYNFIRFCGSWWTNHIFLEGPVHLKFSVATAVAVSLHVHILGRFTLLMDLLCFVLASLTGSTTQWVECAGALRLQSDLTRAWCYCKMSCREMLACNCQLSWLGVFVGCVYSGRQLQLCRLMVWTVKHRSPFNDCGKLCNWLDRFGAHFLHGQPPCQECSR